MAGVLDGLRILDLTRGVAGPMATMLLTDHGADVTRIEPPGGDPFRDQVGYRAWNRGKRSAILDLRDAEDKASFLALAAGADVVVESFAPGTTSRLGIDFETLSATNPRLVYCSITGYGRGNSHSESTRLRCPRRGALRPPMGATRMGRRIGAAPVGPATALPGVRSPSGAPTGTTA